MSRIAKFIMFVSATFVSRGSYFRGRRRAFEENGSPMIIDPSVIRQVSREKDIDPEKMFGALEEAMSSAARKYYRDKAVVTLIYRKTGEMTVYSHRTIVEVLDTESEEPPPQVLIEEARELVRTHGTKGEIHILRPGAGGEGPTEGSEGALG